jgi:hypothetical protein
VVSAKGRDSLFLHAACPSCGRQPIGSYAPNPTRKYLCPYCNEPAVLREDGVIVDAFTNVCHEACLDRERRFAEAHRV